MTDRHAWFRARLEAHLSGLLDEREDRLFVEHASACDACAKRLADYALEDEPATDTGHVPAGMFAAWPRATRELRGLERMMVRRHLERCAACRQELELLGHSPALPLDAALEGAHASDAAGTAAAAVAAGGVAAGSGSPRVIVMRSGGARRWDAWFAWSGWAAAVLMVAIMLVAPWRAPGISERERELGRGTLAPSAERAAPVPEAGEAVPGLAIPVRLAGRMRGDASGATRVEVPANACQLALAIPALDIPDTAAVRVQLLGPGGGVLDERQLRNSDLFGSALVLMGHWGRPFEPGRHRVVVRGAPGPGALVTGDEVREFELDVARR